VPGSKNDLWVKNIQRTLIMMGRVEEPVQDIPAGNTAALVIFQLGVVVHCELISNQQATQVVVHGCNSAMPRFRTCMARVNSWLFLGELH
jgi:translation elongation factor EF-G